MKYRSDSPSEGDSNSSSNSTSTASMGGAAAAPPRHKSKSGIFDISRTTDIKSPVELFGYSASTSTKERARRNAASAGLKADILRTLFTMILVPILAAATYMGVTGRTPQLSLLGFPGPLQRANMQSPKTTRKPASSLPIAKQVELTPAHSDDATTSLLPLKKTPQPLKLTFDSNGHLITPFAVELDENGLEVGRTENQDRLALMPAILSEEFRNCTSVAKFTLPPNFTGVPNAHPFIFSTIERNRLIQLRKTAPEIKKMLAFASASTAERLRVSPIAAASLQSSDANDRTAIDAIRELSWVQKATLTANVSGDSLIEKRILETLLTWARTYQPSGNSIVEKPLFDLLQGYDFVRANIDAKDKATLDEFFRKLVDRQFARARALKEYNLEHAAHTQFAVAVGFITEDVALQYYATAQYQAHIDHAPLFSETTFGPNELETLRTLLQTAFVLERSGSNAYKSEKLNQILTAIVDGSQDEPQNLLNTIGAAAYFRPEFYPRIATLATSLSPVASRFGTANTALLAALRKPNSSLLADTTAARASNAATVRAPASRATAKPRR